jgi:hypothetical protein
VEGEPQRRGFYCPEVVCREKGRGLHPERARGVTLV